MGDLQVKIHLVQAAKMMAEHEGHKWEGMDDDEQHVWIARAAVAMGVLSGSLKKWLRSRGIAVPEFDA